jgi:alkanesulfonate monooxygenase SsuD/methylene tetrahydromethanopterin reductase-like flavin-dependent oxidoreductase (luciferase family)
MRFGIFYEHQLPRPWAEGDELQLFQDALDQCALADRVGFDYVWEVEHHFLEEYSHSSAPEVFLAAVSQRTENLRLGHGIIQTAPGYNHPARTAERVATLDLVSKGRVEFGSGESSSIAELGGFDIDPADKRPAWEEGLRVAVRCMTEEPFTGHEGKYCRIPPRNVVPKPVQKPHPPLWVACSRRDTILLAAQKGLGALSFAFIDPEEAQTWVRDYRETIARECSPIGHFVNPDIACVTPMMMHPDEKTAIARGLEGANFFGYSLAHFYIFGSHVPGRTNVWEEFQQRRAEQGYSPEVAAALEMERLGAKVAAAGGDAGLRGAVGTPDQVRDYLRRYEEAGVDQIIFVLQSGRNRHEHIMESIERFGHEVLPEFKDRDEKLRAEKTKALEPALEAAMRRRVDDAPPMPEDYRMDALPKSFVKQFGGDDLVEKLADGTAVGDDTVRNAVMGRGPAGD